jgi:hypothetical protein
MSHSAGDPDALVRKKNDITNISKFEQSRQSFGLKKNDDYNLDLFHHF